MRIAVIGSGGREHALVWKLKESPQTRALFCIPGNAGIQRLAECLDVPLDPAAGFRQLLDWLEQNDITLTVVGPEAPLAEGLVDAFYHRFGKDNGKRLIFGPTGAAARLESSKVFAKAFLQKWKIPTAQARVCRNAEEVDAARAALGLPIVLKADGLAAGKGVWVCLDEAAFVAAKQVFFEEKRFGKAAAQVLVEEFLEGEEVSLLAICDGETALDLASVEDHKRLLDGDQGPNTGGMGAYSPAPIFNEELRRVVLERVIAPTMAGMKAEGAPFSGVLFAGLMVTKKGPQVLEFNCRFGDPETQPLMMRLQSDFAALLAAAASGKLRGYRIAWDERPAVCVVMVSGGYPGVYENGHVIEGLPEAARVPATVVFHAGTAYRGKEIVTAGGRVLGITALGKTLKEAIDLAYQGVRAISWAGEHHRTDIGAKGLKRTYD